jgi:hypothetical protein
VREQDLSLVRCPQAGSFGLRTLSGIASLLRYDEISVKFHLMGGDGEISHVCIMRLFRIYNTDDVYGVHFHARPLLYMEQISLRVRVYTSSVLCVSIGEYVYPVTGERRIFSLEKIRRFFHPGTFFLSP